MAKLTVRRQTVYIPCEKDYQLSHYDFITSPSISRHP